MGYLLFNRIYLIEWVINDYLEILKKRKILATVLLSISWIIAIYLIVFFIKNFFVNDNFNQSQHPEMPNFRGV